MASSYRHMYPQGINIVFAGGSYEADDFQKIGVRKHLVTYFAKPDVEMRSWEKFAKDCPDDDFFLILDSGAFSAWNSGVEINIDNLIEYMHKWKDVYTIAANLDKIPGERRKAPTKDDVHIAAEVGWKNSKYILSKGVPQDKLMPIFHQGEDFRWLKLMVDEGYQYIGISPSNDYSTEQRMFWLDEVYEYLTKQNRWYIKTHGYGATSQRLMKTYPWFTVDSTSWVQQAGFGQIATPFGNICMSNDPNNYDKPGCYHTLPGVEKEQLDGHIKQMGFEIDKLIEWKYEVEIKGQKVIKDRAYMERRKFNVKFLQNWEKNYKYEPKPFKEQEDIFKMLDEKLLHPKKLIRKGV